MPDGMIYGGGAVQHYVCVFASTHIALDKLHVFQIYSVLS